jgi:hypothetical protein
MYSTKVSCRSLQLRIPVNEFTQTHTHTQSWYETRTIGISNVILRSHQTRYYTPGKCDMNYRSKGRSEPEVL